MNKTRKIIVGVFSTVLVLIAIIGITYAYFVARVQGNTNTVSISTKAGILSLVYGEGQNDIIEATNILPGYTNTKNFTVTNNGTGTASYGVFLEDLRNTFTRTSDLKLTVTCTSNISGNTCNGLTQSNFPTQNDLLITNEIEKDEVQTYTLTFEYLNVDANQNADNNASLFAKVQIYDLDSTVDLEGTVTNSQPGDYVVVNSSPKRSEIVNGTFKVVGLEPDNHTINIYNESGTQKSTNTLTINSGTEESISGTTITVVPESRTITTSVDATSNNSVTISDIEQVNTGGGSAIPNPFTGENTLAYNIFNNAINVTAEQKELLYAEYSEEPKTKPAEEISGETESTLSKTSDGENTYSYYFRGNVANNYVNFAGKCWRIVRIEGDGSIKLILEDKDYTCDNSNYTGNWLIATGNYGYTQGKVTNSSGQESSSNKWVADYLNGQTDATNSMKTRLNTWYSNISSEETKLKEETWCIGDTTKGYDYNSGALLSNPTNDLMYNGTDFYYETGKRLAGIGETANATLKCNGTTFTSYIGAITADEVAYAGGKTYTNNQYYYLINNWQKDTSTNGYIYFWTLSSAIFVYGDDRAFVVYFDGSLYYNNANEPYASRPAVSLKSSTEIMSGGVGTQSNPYVIE